MKIKFELQNIPHNKDSISGYYVTGNFNNLKPNDADFKRIFPNVGRLRNS